MRHTLIAMLFCFSAAAQEAPLSYHVGVGFGPYSPPLSALVEAGSMITSKLYLGGQVVYRSTNAPTLAAGIVNGFFHSWNDHNMRDLTTGIYWKWEYTLLTHNNDAYKADPFVPVGFGIRHYWDDFVFVDAGYCQQQITFTLGVKLGRSVFY